MCHSLARITLTSDLISSVNNVITVMSEIEEKLFETMPGGLWWRGMSLVRAGCASIEVGIDTSLKPMDPVDRRKGFSFSFFVASGIDVS